MPSSTGSLSALTTQRPCGTPTWTCSTTPTGRRSCEGRSQETANEAAQAAHLVSWYVIQVTDRQQPPMLPYWHRGLVVSPCEALGGPPCMEGYWYGRGRNRRAVWAIVVGRRANARDAL